MSYILASIFVSRLLSLPLKIAIKEIKENAELENKEVEIVFIDLLNKSYFESLKNNDKEIDNYLRVVNYKLNQEGKIYLYVAYEISELIKEKKRC